jgi:glycerophosphoryl diester phosphodiesterase
MSLKAAQVVAHRGLQRLFPENTRASVLGALRAGLTQVEIDVQMTADRMPVVLHDATLARISGRRGDIRRMTWSQARRLPAHEPGRFGRRYRAERLCSLEALALQLAAEPGLRTLFVELKEESLRVFGREAMLQACAEALAPIRRRCALISFDLKALQLARETTRFPVGLVLRSLAQWRRPEAKRLRCEWVFCDAALLPAQGALRPLFGRARSVVYEVPQAERARALLARGVHAIETFRSDSLALELGLYL